MKIKKLLGSPFFMALATVVLLFVFGFWLLGYIGKPCIRMGVDLDNVSCERIEEATLSRRPIIKNGCEQAGWINYDAEELKLAYDIKGCGI